MSKTQAQAVLLSMACAILAASDTLDNIEDADLPLDDPCEDSEVLEVVAAVMIHEALEIKGDGTRGPYNQFPKSKDWFPTSLQQPDRWFRSNYRMSRDMFDRLVFMLAPNTIFLSPKKRQRHVKYQLAAFLIRYGQRGSDVFDVASKLGLGLGTVHLYCRRITRALLSQRIEARSGFPKCVGSGDGCQIRMSTAPEENPDEFLSRKKEHSTNVQATVDDECRFTSFDLGWPGCVTDSKIFKYSHLWRHRHHYFKDGEYILVDKGYISSPWTIRPFDEPEISSVDRTKQQRMREFNVRLSKMGWHKNLQEMYKHILDFDPSDNTIPVEVAAGDIHFGLVDVTQEANIPQYETDQWIKEEGRRKRDLIFNDLFPI